ncbi:MAG TPA: septum formation initiator family protein [Actinomycetota bacterium]|nr:septum formation initiator family protein [Actinomycetota bacterium]
MTAVDPRARAEEAGPGAVRLGLIRRRSRSLIRRRPGTRLAALGAVAAILVGALVFGVLLEQVVLAQSAFKLAGVRRQIARAQEENQDLLLRVTKLDSPARIERFARERLGMVQPRRDELEYIVADIGARDMRVAVVRPGPVDPGAGQAAGPGSPAPGAP